MTLQVTYHDMKRADKREEMEQQAFSRLGTKSGGFGKFSEHFRVLSRTGAFDIRTELEQYCVGEGVPLDALLHACPTLKQLTE